MLFQRMMRAARLDVNLYEEVEADQGATSQAATVVGIVAVAGGIGGAVVALLLGQPGQAALSFVVGIVGAFLSWVLWSYITYWIGTSIFKGTATPGELLRTLGFAQSPGVLNAISFIPFIGWAVALVAFIWYVIAGVVAVRQALDISTGQAVITVLIGLIPYLLFLCLYGLVVNGAGFMDALGGAR